MIEWILVSILSLPHGENKRLTLEQEDFDCAALAVYHEAKNQSVEGQKDIYHVIANRVESKLFPNTVCDVVQEARKHNGKLLRNKCQFSFFCDGKSDKPQNDEAWTTAQKAVLEANRETDKTNGALWYHAKNVKPYWSKTFEKVHEMGDHIFYRSEKR